MSCARTKKKKCLNLSVCPIKVAAVVNPTQRFLYRITSLLLFQWRETPQVLSGLLLRGSAENVMTRFNSFIILMFKQNLRKNIYV